MFATHLFHSQNNSFEIVCRIDDETTEDFSGLIR